MLRFSAMNVVVTGASRGIGLEFCRLALASEARVLAVARQPAESHGLSELRKKSASALQVVQADVSRPGASEAILAAAREWGPVDILINNAGIMRTINVHDVSATFAKNSLDLAMNQSLSASYGPLSLVGGNFYATNSESEVHTYFARLPQA